MTASTPARRPNRKDEKREATRGRLIDAARRLFAERGYDSTSVTEIAEAAGVTHAMINVYFNGKAGLLYEIISESNDDQITRSSEAETLEGGTLERLTRIMAIWAEADLSDPRLAAVIFGYSWQWPAQTEAHNRKQRHAAFEPKRRIIARGIAEGELRTDLDVEELVHVVYAIYLWGVRPAIFEGASRQDCLDTIRGRIELVLSGARR